MKNEPDIIDHYLSVINTEGRNLTPWEADFIESIEEQWKERGSLSERQEEILERIYSERTP